MSRVGVGDPRYATEHDGQTLQCCECSIPVYVDGAQRALLLLPCQHVMHMSCVEFVQRRHKLQLSLWQSNATTSTSFAASALDSRDGVGMGDGEDAHPCANRTDDASYTHDRLNSLHSPGVWSSHRTLTSSTHNNTSNTASDNSGNGYPLAVAQFTSYSVTHTPSLNPISATTNNAAEHVSCSGKTARAMLAESSYFLCPSCALPVRHTIPLFAHCDSASQTARGDGETGHDDKTIHRTKDHQDNNSNRNHAKDGTGVNDRRSSFHVPPTRRDFHAVHRAQKRTLRALRGWCERRVAVTRLARQCAACHEERARLLRAMREYAKYFPPRTDALHASEAAIGCHRVSLPVEKMTVTELELYVAHTTPVLLQTQNALRQERAAVERGRRRLAGLKKRYLANSMLTASLRRRDSVDDAQAAILHDSSRRRRDNSIATHNRSTSDSGRHAMSRGRDGSRDRGPRIDAGRADVKRDDTPHSRNSDSLHRHHGCTNERIGADRGGGGGSHSTSGCSSGGEDALDTTTTSAPTEPAPPCADDKREDGCVSNRRVRATHLSRRLREPAVIDVDEFAQEMHTPPRLHTRTPRSSCRTVVSRTSIIEEDMHDGATDSEADGHDRSSNRSTRARATFSSGLVRESNVITIDVDSSEESASDGDNRRDSDAQVIWRSGNVAGEEDESLSGRGSSAFYSTLEPYDEDASRLHTNSAGASVTLHGTPHGHTRMTSMNGVRHEAHRGHPSWLASANAHASPFPVRAGHFLHVELSSAPSAPAVGQTDLPSSLLPANSMRLLPRRENRLWQASLPF